MRWKRLEGFNYCVSEEGDVVNLSTGLIKKQTNVNGYRAVAVWIPSKQRSCLLYIHVLLMELFGPPKPGPEFEVNHKDCVRSNNNLDNLEWTTHQQNIHLAFAKGRMHRRGTVRRLKRE